MSSFINSCHLSFGTHPSQFGCLQIPELPGQLPVIVTIHGGYWDSRYGLNMLDPLDNDLNGRGYATWNIEYRRTGETGGGWNGTFLDVVAAVNYLSQIAEQFPIDLSRVVILGHSAGGHLALWLTSRCGKTAKDEMGDVLHIPIKGAIGLAGIPDLKRMWELDAAKGVTSPVASFIGGTPEMYPNRYKLASPIELLPVKIPQILIHGCRDTDVPIELSAEYYRKAVECGCNIKLIRLPEADHFQFLNPLSPAWAAAIDAIAALLTD